MACATKALAAALMVLFFGVAAHAQEPSSEDIVVTSQRVREMAETFAAAVAVAPVSEDQYARWNSRLCPSVSGLAGEDAQTLIDHIALRANAVGLVVEPSGCQPNLVLVFAPDSDAITRQIVDSRRDLLGYYSDDDLVTAGREALEAFANTPRAVRWWHVANTVTADGRVLRNSGSRTGRGTLDAVRGSQGMGAEAATTGNGFGGMEAVRSNGTRARRATRQDLGFVLVVVDTRRIAGVPTSAVADYLAMASLVHLDPEADMSAYPSILNLFAPRPSGVAPPLAMSAWDQAYLEGLYAMTREAANSRQQRSQIARRMAEAVAQE
ncbi:MAG: hypothetical protein JNM59_12585 [Hyphomonadaceae bacterium]|nr:hypothetical protein [Hyphomonadaceae bacterium]